MNEASLEHGGELVLPCFLRFKGFSAARPTCPIRFFKVTAWNPVILCSCLLSCSQPLLVIRGRQYQTTGLPALVLCHLPGFEAAGVRGGGGESSSVNLA